VAQAVERAHQHAPESGHEEAVPGHQRLPATCHEESGPERVIPLLRYYHVFNTAQCDGLGDTPSAAMSAPAPETLYGKPDAIVAGMPTPPVIKHGFACAYYSPSDDEVGLPDRERFDTKEAYYSTLFHELIHSTGHETRLNRPLTFISGYGRDPYCKEELIAEMGAAFLCAHAEIVEATIHNSAAYIDGWLKQLRRDKTLVVHTAAQAQRAADFILTGNRVECEISND
jgi:antirestriction protein ArdC